MSTKERLLEILEEHRGEILSGEALAGQLKVSRNAVWKAMNELKKAGYPITASTKTGYALAAESDILSAQGLKPYLARPERCEGVYVFKTVESTNRTAKEMAIAGAEHGTVVIADSQTGGRGRRDRGFFSPPGKGLYMSLILRPGPLRLESPTAITAFAAVMTCSAIEAVSGKKPMIKWVNDIYLHYKKVCGILTEAVTDFESGGVQWVVLGIGVNVSARVEDFPGALRETATSVDPDGRIPGLRNRLAAEIINRILDAEPMDERAIFSAYRQRLMMLGQIVSVRAGEETYPARALDINEVGHLIVEKENGETAILPSGEISIRQRDR